jgi:hypothetical protein
MTISSENKSPRPSFWRDLNPGDHVCHVYQDEVGLLDTLSGFIGGGLWAGESAIVIATDLHLIRLEEMLRQTGLDLAHFRATDAYIPLSAEVCLSNFMDGGWPDNERFDAFLRPTLLRARRGGREVRVFGEMVALLWARGQYAATVRLEHLWNRALEREKIRLVCGYPKGELAHGHAESIRQIDDSHSFTVRY